MYARATRASKVDSQSVPAMIATISTPSNSIASFTDAKKRKSGLRCHGSSGVSSFFIRGTVRDGCGTPGGSQSPEWHLQQTARYMCGTWFSSSGRLLNLTTDYPDG